MIQDRSNRRRAKAIAITHAMTTAQRNLAVKAGVAVAAVVALWDLAWVVRMAYSAAH
jgi:hypothetical protein